VARHGDVDGCQLQLGLRATGYWLVIVNVIVVMRMCVVFSGMLRASLSALSADDSQKTCLRLRNDLFMR